MTAKKSKTIRNGALVSGRGHLSWLDTVRTHLSENNRIVLTNSCFGHLLSVPDIQFQGQLYHALIKRLERSSLGRQRLAFRINNNVVEFGPLDFSLMTGLRMYGWEEPPTESHFHESYFEGRTDLMFDDIQRCFVRECKASGGNSGEALKLAFLYILYGILLIRSRRSKRIDLKYFHLIDDIEKFNTFAWGQVAYEFLVRTAHRAREIMDNLVIEGKTVSYDANGFAVALQTWVYEIMPNIADVCAMRVPGMEEQIPRIMRWSSNKHFRYARLNRLLNAKNAAKYPLDITLSPKEERMMDLLGVHDITVGPLADNCAGEVSYKHRRLPKKDVRNDVQQKRKQSQPIASRISKRLREGLSDVETIPETSVIISGLLERVASLEKTIKELKPSPCEKDATSQPGCLSNLHQNQYDPPC